MAIAQPLGDGEDPSPLETGPGEMLPQLSSLQRICLSMNAQNRVDQILKVLAAGAAQLTGFPRCIAMEVDPANGTVRQAALKAVEKEFSYRVRRPREIGATRLALKEGRPVIISSGLEGPVSLRPEDLEAGIRTVIGVPIADRGDPCGVLIACSTIPRAVWKKDVHILSLLARHGAVALKNVMELNRHILEEKKLSSLYEVSARVVRKGDLEDILDAVARAGARLAGARSAAVRLLTEEGRELRLMAGYNLSEEYRSRTPLRVGIGVAGIAAQECRPVAVEDITLDRRVLYADLAARLGIRSLVSIPLTARGRVIGVISLFHYLYRRYTPEELACLTAFGDEAGIAIENTIQLFRSRERLIGDGVSGLYSRVYLRERLDEELKRADQSDQPVTILYCDLDSFRPFKERNGTRGAEIALAEAGRIIKGCIRGVDLAARIEEDEFIVALVETDGSQAQVVAERIRKELASFPFIGRDQGPDRLTISIGISVYPTDAQFHESLMDKARWAMGYAKRKGGNTVHWFVVEEEPLLTRQTYLPGRQPINLAVAHALASAADLRDPYQKPHSEEVARYATLIARNMGFADLEVWEIRQAALLHDVGKISIASEIWLKRGELSPDEWRWIKEHPQTGVNILREIPEMRRMLPSVLHHQEKYDGTGFPRGLSKEDIPMGARILAVADSFHAMISDRPYRPRLNSRDAVAQLQAGSGKQFDPDAVRALSTALKGGEVV